jgi:hypothetical protein
LAQKLLYQLTEGLIMEAAIGSEAMEVIGRLCNLRRPIRDRAGRTRFNETPIILREVFNLDRRMYLVKFADGATTFVFPNEVDVA